ncbi:hypothetical protein V8C44DRAFT_339000 [Trichoderma aethiopicum]
MYEACQSRSIRRLALLLNQLLFPWEASAKRGNPHLPGGKREPWPLSPAQLTPYGDSPLDPTRASLLRIPGIEPCGLAMDCREPSGPIGHYFGLLDACVVVSGPSQQGSKERPPVSHR